MSKSAEQSLSSLMNFLQAAAIKGKNDYDREIDRVNETGESNEWVEGQALGFKTAADMILEFAYATQGIEFDYKVSYYVIGDWRTNGEITVKAPGLNAARDRALDQLAEQYNGRPGIYLKAITKVTA